MAAIQLAYPAPWSRKSSLNMLHVAQKNIVMDYDPFYNTIDRKCYVFTRVFAVHSKDVSIYGRPTTTNILWIPRSILVELASVYIKVSSAAQMLASLASHSLPIPRHVNLFGSVPFEFNLNNIKE